jgi:predicted transcriptional regulator
MIEVFPNGDGSIKVSCSKTKDEQPWAEQQYRFLPVGETKSGVLIPSIGYAVMEYSEQEYRILDFLSLDTFTTSGARISQLVNALNIPERTIYRLLSHLKREGQIKHGRRGDPFFLTDDGKGTLLHWSAKESDVTEIVVE